MPSLEKICKNKKKEKGKIKLTKLKKNQKGYCCQFGAQNNWI